MQFNEELAHIATYQAGKPIEEDCAHIWAR